MTEPSPPPSEDAKAPYEAPKVEDLQAGDGPSVTAAGVTATPGVE